MTGRGPIVEPTASVLRPLGADAVRITGGFWGERQELNARVIIGHCRRWMERIGWIGNFRRAADGTVATEHAGIEFVDSEVYKLLEAMAWELGRRADPVLEAEYADLVATVAAAQEADGYLHTSFGRPGQRPRYSDLRWGHELYCFGHLFQAAVARLRSGHDDTLPAVARRLADHVLREFGPAGRTAICGHPEIETALVELGRATGDRRYIDLGGLFLARRGRRTIPPTVFQGSDYFLDDVPVRDAEVLRGHAVRAYYLAAGAVDVATETGDAELLAAVERQVANTVARRTYITGGVGSHHQNEAIGDDFELPADRAYCESCAAIASVMTHWRLLLATGSPGYADGIERTLLNAFLVGSRADGRAFFYANTLHQRTVGSLPADDALSVQAEASIRAPWFEVSCCPTNIARTFAQLAGYFVTTDDRGVQLHQYGDLEVSTALPDGTPVRLRVETGYPFDGRVRITVLEAATFTLGLRVPAWAVDATIESGGEVVAAAPGLVRLRRGFTAGDVVTLQLPMRARAVAADPRVDGVRGTLAVERGPLVLCLESVDLPPDLPFDRARLAGQVETTDDGATARLTAAPGGSDAAWPYGPQPDVAEARSAVVPLRPYFAWGNRGAAAMRVWLPIEGTWTG